MSYKSPSSFNLSTRPLFIVVSGPSGVGKDAVLTRMKELGYPVEYIVTVTTRPQRAKEKDNVDYHFISVASFQEMIETITAQAREGRYTATSMYRAWQGWSFADKKQPTPWLTCLVLRTLRRAAYR